MGGSVADHDEAFLLWVFAEGRVHVEVLVQIGVLPPAVAAVVDDEDLVADLEGSLALRTCVSGSLEGRGRRAYVVRCELVEVVE